MSSLTEIPCRDVRFFSTKFNISRTASRRPPRCAPALDEGAEVRRACRAWEISSSAVRKWPDSSSSFTIFSCSGVRLIVISKLQRIIGLPVERFYTHSPAVEAPTPGSARPVLVLARHRFSFCRHSPPLFTVDGRPVPEGLPRQATPRDWRNY